MFIAVLFSMLMATAAEAGTSVVAKQKVKVQQEQVFVPQVVPPAAVVVEQPVILATTPTVTTAKIKLTDRVKANMAHRRALRQARVLVATPTVAVATGCIGLEASCQGAHTE
jgi:hypothetical protein